MCHRKCPVHKYGPLLAIAILAGCGFKEYRDVSALPENAPLVNQEYLLREELLLHAVARNNNKVTDYYTITTKPGFAGRYVVFRRVLPVGTLLRIKQVQECTTWLCSDKQLLVELPGLPYSDHPITVRDTFDGIDMLTYENGRATINPHLLESAKR